MSVIPDGTHARLLLGDCLERMKELPDNSVDSIVTDPPYGLSKQPDMAEVMRHWLADDDYKHKSAGFMGKSWDSFVPSPKVWREALRVLKPGGHLLAFAGTRTQDLMALSIRLAGFEIRDSIEYLYESTRDAELFYDSLTDIQKQAFQRLQDQGDARMGWMFGSGFPKSGNIDKAIDKAAGAEREISGAAVYADGRVKNNGGNAKSGYSGGLTSEGAGVRMKTAPATEAAKQWDGWGTSLKPAHEPIVMARKPFKGTVAGNVLVHGTGAINIDGCRVLAEDGGRPLREVAALRDDVQYSGNALAGRLDGSLASSKAVGSTDQGRWPANVIHDGSDELVGLFPDVKSGGGNGARSGGSNNRMPWKTYAQVTTNGQPPSNGSSARFFYCAKASKTDRGADNSHPTVKPTALMRYLCRLVTPPGGVVLDPFMGSGSTGKAAMLEGFRFVGVEMDQEFSKIAASRIKQAMQDSE